MTNDFQVCDLGKVQVLAVGGWSTTPCNACMMVFRACLKHWVKNHNSIHQSSLFQSRGLALGISLDCPHFSCIFHKSLSVCVRKTATIQKIYNHFKFLTHCPSSRPTNVHLYVSMCLSAQSHSSDSWKSLLDSKGGLAQADWLILNSISPQL